MKNGYKTLDDALQKTFERVKGQRITEETERINLTFNIVSYIGKELLKRRAEYLSQISRDGGKIVYDKQHKVDVVLTNYVINRIRSNKTSRRDQIVTEDVRTPASIDAAVTWLCDAVDGTKMYLSDSRSDFGSALTAIDSEGSAIVSSYILPARGILYLSIRNSSWRNGNPIVVDKGVSSNVAVVRRPRKWMNEDWYDKLSIMNGKTANGSEITESERRLIETEAVYKNIEVGLRKEYYVVEKGQDLATLDILSLALNGTPDRFFYYSKPWDSFAGAAIANAAGTQVHWLQDIESRKWKPIFPIQPDLWKRIKERNRIMIRIMRPSDRYQNR